MILSEHLVRCDTDGIDYNTHWYKWTVGRLQQVFLTVSCINHFVIIVHNFALVAEVSLSINAFVCVFIDILLCICFSIKSKYKNIHRRWKLYCSHLTWILIFWMCSINLFLYAHKIHSKDHFVYFTYIENLIIRVSLFMSWLHKIEKFSIILSFSQLIIE